MRIDFASSCWHSIVAEVSPVRPQHPIRPTPPCLTFRFVSCETSWKNRLAGPAEHRPRQPKRTLPQLHPPPRTQVQRQNPKPRHLPHLKPSAARAETAAKPELDPEPPWQFPSTPQLLHSPPKDLHRRPFRPPCPRPQQDCPIGHSEPPPVPSQNPAGTKTRPAEPMPPRKPAPTS